jgi:hypothetical protein
LHGFLGLAIGVHMSMFKDTAASPVFLGRWLGRIVRRILRWSAVSLGSAISTMGDASDIDKGVPPRTAPPRRLVLGRPRWTNIALILSLILFWAGVILKLLS